MFRLVTPGQRAGFKENLAAMMMSAFWHGFYPGYYVMFFFFGIINEVTKDVYRAWPLFVDVP